MSLAHKAISSAAWSVGTSVFSRAIGMVGTLLLIRFLRPDDYGDAIAAATLVLSANQLTTLGLGIYLISNPETGTKVSFHATVLHVTLGVISLGAAFLMRHHLAALFGTPGAAVYVGWLTLATLLDRVAQMPERLLVRQMRFRTVTLARSVGELVYTGLSVGLCAGGLGAMGIIWGNIGRSVVRNVWILRSLSPSEWLKPHPLDFKLMRRLAGFGTGIYVGGLAGFASRRWDNFVMSALFGPAVLGQYNLAYNLADVPATQVGEQITDVMLASFPRIEQEKRYNALLRVTRILALLILPLAIGLGVVAPTLASMFTSDKWNGVGPFLLVLSALSIGRPPSNALVAYAQSRSRPWTIAIIEWGTLVVLLPGMYFLGHLGPLWAAGAVGVAFFARYVAYLVWMRSMDGFPILPFLADMARPLLASALMGAAIMVARPFLRATAVGHKSAGLLLAEMAIGVVVYVPAAFLVARTASRDVVGLAVGLIERRRRRGRGTPPAVASTGS